MNNSNLIQDIPTRNAIKRLEEFMKRIEGIQKIAVPHDASPELRVTIQTINKITNNFKRNM